MEVGTYIKHLRTQKGLSQEELGKIVGVQRAAVQKWECGATQNLKKDIIKKLASFFDVSPIMFIENKLSSGLDIKSNIKINERLKTRRKELGLTMLDVAKKVGVSEATVSRWESGDISNMKRDKIVLLANALKISPNLIIEENSSMEESDFYKNSPEQNSTNEVKTMNKETCGTRIKKALSIRNMRAIELCNKTGIPKSAMSQYINDRFEPKQDRVYLIAQALDVTEAWLMGYDVPMKSEARKEFSKSDNLPEPEITEDVTTFPVIGEVAAGYESIADENWMGETVDIPISYLQGHNKADFFVLKVKGDSMIPLYHEGDKVLILKQSTMNYSGQIGVVIYGDDKGTLKRVEYAQGEDWMRLVPLNLNHPIVRIENEDLEHCRVIGIPRLLIREIKD